MKKLEEQVRDGRIKHGMKGTKFYKCWENMKARCDNPNHSSYKNYGGRGIGYIKDWKDFACFFYDMHEAYLAHVERHTEKNTTLDRIDTNKNYSKRNCRWATKIKQAQNKRNNHVYKGETQGQASARLGGSHSMVADRINVLGWSPEKAFTTPKTPNYGKSN